MKKLLVVLFAVALTASLASAEMLVTANPIGQGRWALLGAYMQDADYMKPAMAGLTLTTIGGYVGYGITDQLDLLLQLASSNVGGLPAGVTGTGTGYGLNLKYTLLSEGANMPVSVALGGGYQVQSIKVTAIPDQNVNQMLVAAGVSKVIAPFVPYAGVAYKMLSSDGQDAGNMMDISVGSAIAWSEQGAVFVEYTMQSITPKGVASYTGSQIALGVGYTI